MNKLKRNFKINHVSSLNDIIQNYHEAYYGKKPTLAAVKMQTTTVTCQIKNY